MRPKGRGRLHYALKHINIRRICGRGRARAASICHASVALLLSVWVSYEREVSVCTSGGRAVDAVNGMRERPWDAMRPFGSGRHRLPNAQWHTHVRKKKFHTQQ